MVEAEVLGCGAGTIIPDMIIGDEAKGILSTIVGFVRQVFAHIWDLLQTIWVKCMEDPWKLAHLAATTAILFA